MRTLVGLDEAGSHFSKFSEKAQEANDLPCSKNMFAAMNIPHNYLYVHFKPG